MSKKQKAVAALSCLGVSQLLLVMAQRSPGFAEKYASCVYPLFVGSIGRFFGVFPWSVAELGLYLLCMALAASLIAFLAKVMRKKAPLQMGGSLVLNWALTASVLFLLYVLLCGINYRRTSFASHAGLEESSYTTEDLRQLCVSLTEEVNAAANKVKRDGEGCMILEQDMKEEAVAAMKKLGETYPVLEGFYPKPKGLVVPWILSVQNLTGIYAPFTVEANYNTAMTPYNIPFTVCHELVHLRGFMEEEEANFISWLACISSDQQEFRYSGNLLAWIYSMNALYKADRASWREIGENLAVQAKADLAANSEFWSRYEGRVAQVANTVNDTYLKANGQADGVESYGKMVDLLLAYRRCS